MSKRGAQGPQGSKESNLFEFNMSGTPDEKPQRATAAQLANRKIKDPRKRRTTTAPTNAPAPSFGSPFNSSDSNPVSSPGAGTQAMSNGFSFGQSQSFPGAGSNPPPPTQNGSSPFSFGAGSGSSSFNFSTTGGPPTGGNPFATMNTANSTGPSQPPTGGGFSFTGNTFSTPSSNVQPPSQQAPPAGGIFGSGPQQNNASAGLFNFGANGPAASKPASSAPASTGSIFGQSTTSTSAPPFGQQPLAKSPPFGNSAVFGNDSMQTSPDAKTNGLAAKPSIFSGGASTGFGASTDLAGSGSVFGGSPAKPAQTPSKPVETKPAGTPTPSLFGATTPGTTAVGTSSTPAPATTGATPFQFGSPAPASPAATPFQSTNLFAGAPKAPEQKKEDKPSEPPAKNLFQFAPSTSGPSTTSPSLFSKSETAATPAAPASGLFQPPSSGSLFAPKPAVSAEQDQSKPAEAKPFGNLFAPKPATPSQPATEQQPPSSGNPFGNLFAPKPSDGEKPATTPAPLFSAPAPSASPLKPATPFGQPSSPFGQSQAPTAATPSEPKTQAPAQPASTSQTNGTKVFVPLSTDSSEKGAAALKEKLGPSRLPDALTPQTAEEVELLHRVRLLNKCFQLEVAKLNPAEHDFLNVVEFYVRVRETFGAPTGSVTTKRKTRDDESEPVDGQDLKKIKASFGGFQPAAASSKENSPAATPASADTTTPAKPSETTPPTPAGGKRKSSDDSEDTQGSPPKKVNGESSTANIFAQSFSKSKSSDSPSEPAQPEPSPSTQPSTPQTPKFSFSTTPAASPSKPLFPTPAAASQPATGNSLFSASASVSKPTFGTPAASSSPAPAPNPFTLKPSNGESAAGAPGSAPAIPKFGSGGVDFFAQFKSQADKNAEKEKQKRKDEDFDSDEDDEAEWERKDAEQQRKKREEAEARAAKRPKFVPGKGFVFEDDNTDVATKPAEETSSGPSVFETKTAAAPAKASNIFGHLSATPSEIEEPDNDGDVTEEASIDGDENGTTSKDSLFVSASERSSRDVSEAGSKGVSGSGAEFSANDSSDDGDLSKALKKSKPAAAQKSEQPGNRSLMGRVQESGTPKSQGEEEKKNPFANLFAAPKPPSSTGTPASSTPNPFAPVSKPASEQSDASAPKPATPSLFGAPAPAGGLFGSSAPSSGGSTPSIFAAGQSPSKPAGDNTWKMNSPIKFASDSTPKPDSGSETPASNGSKPFSTLFGAPAAEPSPGNGNSQPQSGFSFGNPSPSSSFLAPSSINSAAASRSTTPGASDTGADSSGDTEGAESLPQVDFSKGGAGEENEDALMATRARAMKLTPGTGWESQGVGFLRVLKDRTTSRCRVLLRADPSGNIVLNTSLKKEIKYSVKGNSVYFIVPQASGTLEQWALRVKTEEAPKLGSVLEENKC
ncbi:hypothetical protein P168DRAFT_316704 [Aspergillus campestris IBT 28561]|uniref:RanBD1 domain-containing protein n=1 Tax=Aspergillus campestris (strain IBT 28561) TaxID=1392248 RepID=A0A2I1DA16_ASPC2|nr:uncharacterized protein P168DRAFT_316704 [Aspergillus campestris IBT 28561]PKY06720.1 hypothetical protein P168DRAFT_316704 [Aspergillus campestris IBT 28561]